MLKTIENKLIAIATLKQYNKQTYVIYYINYLALLYNTLINKTTYLTRMSLISPLMKMRRIPSNLVIRLDLVR